ncbi:hypothetical protein M9H77_36185 [Catharanthus roseus]|uniref:Uncharacterized protein n=1 Tax=Catharanthus roseus TaxID=4058 RepID=A0ACB9ZRH1_CATRO|nr:hypothetical protein M9H77_36185 [Catharanthus roseus]
MASISSLPYVEGSSMPSLFDGTNYSFWKSRIRIYISFINFDLWSIVEKVPYVPQKNGRIKKVEEFDDYFFLNQENHSVFFLSLISLFETFKFKDLQNLYSKSSKIVKVKNANIGRGENTEEGGSSRGRVGKGKSMPYGVSALDRFISMKEAAKF